jgi:hypothetical protein
MIRRSRLVNKVFSPPADTRLKFQGFAPNNKNKNKIIMMINNDVVYKIVQRFVTGFPPNEWATIADHTLPNHLHRSISSKSIALMSMSKLQ